MLVSPPNIKVVTAIDSVIATYLDGILFNFLYYNLSSKYIIKPYRKYHSGLINRLYI